MTINLITTYPQFLITPAFTFFTFGPVNVHNDSTNFLCNRCCSNKISVSYKYSWMNVLFTTIIYIVISYVVISDFCLNRTDKTSFCLHRSEFMDPFMDRYVGIILLSCTYPLGILAFILLQVIDNYASCFYNYDCCNNYMIPFTQRTVLNINNSDTEDIIFLNDLKDKD